MTKSISTLGRALARELTDAEIDQVAGANPCGKRPICCVSNSDDSNKDCFCDEVGESEGAHSLGF